MKKHKMVLLELVLAFKLLDSAGLSQNERHLVLTVTSTLDFSSMKSALKRISGGGTVSYTGTINIKEEPVYLASLEKEASRDILDKIEEEVIQMTNFIDKVVQDSETLSKCAICESIFHWTKNFPDGDKSERVNVASHKKDKSNGRPGTSEPPNLKADESVIAVSTKELSVFVSESFDSEVIDTAYTSTVCGRTWLDRYVSSLEAGQRKEIVRNHSDVTFRFDNGRKIVSQESVTIPAKIGDTECKIKTEVVQNDIPLLLSKE